LKQKGLDESTIAPASDITDGTETDGLTVG